jgi:7-cyano-7-deazaguanine synthase in queuosine biosynthesis
VTLYSSPADSAEAVRVDVVESGRSTRRGVLCCEIGRNIKFSTAGLESWFFADSNPAVFDLLVVAAAVEFCDKLKGRPVHAWSRNFELRIPVHDLTLWRQPRVGESLTGALNFLTGDQWAVEFVSRKASVERSGQQPLRLDPDISIVMPYSGGLDSRAVAALFNDEHRQKLVRVHLGSAGAEAKRHGKARRPFATVPYRVPMDDRRARETSARSRGFKFAAVTGIAASLAKASEIIVAESGQGALGPILAVSGQAYADYRSYPAFTARMEDLLALVLAHRPHYQFPRLWRTKAETLAAWAGVMNDGEDWWMARSCWQGSRQVAIDHARRQCGVCAACLLRRMSVHSAGLEEPASGYVWENLRTSDFESGAVAGAAGPTRAMREYMIAGVLHLDQLATMAGSDLHKPVIHRISGELSPLLKQRRDEVNTRLQAMLQRHRAEWLAFLDSLGPNSFVTNEATCRP